MPLWSGRPRKTDFQVDVVQIGEAVLFSSSGKKSGMQFPSWSGTRARISTQISGIVKERK